MKRKSIIALTCAALVSTSLLFTGCGKSSTNNTANNATDNGNTATEKLNESSN